MLKFDIAIIVPQLPSAVLKIKLEIIIYRPDYYYTTAFQRSSQTPFSALSRGSCVHNVQFHDDQKIEQHWNYLIHF